MEILFVIAFFLMLLATGVTFLGVVLALMVAVVVMVVGGLFAFVIKLLPWLLLTWLAVWLYRRFWSPPRATGNDALRRKISKLDRYRRW